MLIFFSPVEHRSSAQSLAKSEKYQIYREIKNCLELVEPIDGKPLEEVVGFWTVHGHSFIFIRLLVFLPGVYDFFPL